MGKIIDSIHESWNPIKHELYKEPLITLIHQILPTISYQPKLNQIFRVFEMPVQDIKVVILGQDPSPSPRQSVGYAYATSPLSKSKTINIIEQEVRNSGVINNSNEIDLFAWVDQGVFLLNTALTVETSMPNSHLKYWENFIKRVISFIATVNPCIWLLWGANIQKCVIDVPNKIEIKGFNRETIKSIPYNNSYNYILTAPHPIIERFGNKDAGFFGCDHFYLTNEILKKNSQSPIKW